MRLGDQETRRGTHVDRAVRFHHVQDRVADEAGIARTITDGAEHRPRHTALLAHGRDGRRLHVDRHHTVGDQRGEHFRLVEVFVAAQQRTARRHVVRFVGMNSRLVAWSITTSGITSSPISRFGSMLPGDTDHDDVVHVEGVEHPHRWLPRPAPCRCWQGSRPGRYRRRWCDASGRPATTCSCRPRWRASGLSSDRIGARYPIRLVPVSATATACRASGRSAQPVRSDVSHSGIVAVTGSYWRSQVVKKIGIGEVGTVGGRATPTPTSTGRARTPGSATIGTTANG